MSTYLTTRQAAAWMGLNASSVRDLCKQGILPEAIRSGPRYAWMIPKKAVTDWIDCNSPASAGSTDQPPDPSGSFLKARAGSIAKIQSRARSLLNLLASPVAHTRSIQPVLLKPHSLPRFSDLLVLPGLSHSAARAAIQGTAAQRGLKVDEDLLDVLLADLGEGDIYPIRLQMLYQEMIDSLPSGETRLTMEAYQQIGGVEPLARRYLESTLEQRIPREDRPEAWNLLSAISRKLSQTATLKELQAELALFPNLRPVEAGRVLGILENERLVLRSGVRYRLASGDFLPRLREWDMERAVRERAQPETARLLSQVGNSAWRALLGGLVGTSLAFLPYYEQVTEGHRVSALAAPRVLTGGLAGLVFVLFASLGLATFRSARRPGRWLASGLAGAGGFTLAIMVNTLLRSAQGWSAPGLAALEMTLWGTAACLGALWVVTSSRPVWQSLPSLALVCVGVLVLADPYASAFGHYGALWHTFAAAALFPLLVVAAAWLGGGSGWEMD
jgi:hypothetical protein